MPSARRHYESSSTRIRKLARNRAFGWVSVTLEKVQADAATVPASEDDVRLSSNMKPSSKARFSSRALNPGERLPLSSRNAMRVEREAAHRGQLEPPVCAIIPRQAEVRVEAEAHRHFAIGPGDERRLHDRFIPRFHNVWMSGASAIGVPECPDWACWTASMDKARMVLMANVVIVSSGLVLSALRFQLAACCLRSHRPSAHAEDVHVVVLDSLLRREVDVDERGRAGRRSLGSGRSGPACEPRNPRPRAQPRADGRPILPSIRIHRDP